jgi:hypothetical protein
MRIHDVEGVAALLLDVSLREPDEVALADVPGVGVAQVAAEKIEREGVAFDVLDELLCATNLESSLVEQLHFLVAPDQLRFHLRVRAARRGGGAQLRLGPEAEADHVDHGIAVAEPAAEHLLDGLILGCESRFIVREAPLLLDLILDRIAERAEFVRDAAEENGGPRFHGEPGGRSGGAPWSVRLSVAEK